MSYDSLITSLSPMARYRLGEDTPGTGTLAESVSAINGAYFASPAGGQTAPAGMSDSAVRFTRASSQYAQVAATNSLNHGDTFTYVVWVKRTAALTSLQVLMSRASTSAMPQLYLNNNAIVVDASSVGNCMVTSGTLTDTASWHMIAVTKSGSSTRNIYLDGVDQALSTSTDRTYSVSNQKLAIGSSPDGANYSNDTICELAVWGSALTAQNILDLYNAGISSAVTGTGAITVPALSVAATGTSVVTGTGAASIAAVAAAGTGTPVVRGSGAASIAAVAAAGSGTPVVAGTGAMAIGAPSVAASGTPVVAGSGAASVSVAASGSGTPVLTGSGAITIPAITGSGTNGTPFSWAGVRATVAPVAGPSAVLTEAGSPGAGDFTDDFDPGDFAVGAFSWQGVTAVLSQVV